MPLAVSFTCSLHHVDIDPGGQKDNSFQRAQDMSRVAQPWCFYLCKRHMETKTHVAKLLLSYTCTTTNDFNGSCS